MLSQKIYSFDGPNSFLIALEIHVFLELWENGSAYLRDVFDNYSYVA
jgi:hypothetical protein